MFPTSNVKLLLVDPFSNLIFPSLLSLTLVTGNTILSNKSVRQYLSLPKS